MITVGEMVREFVVLNHCYALGQLTPARRKRWEALSHIVNLELARFEARAQGATPRARSCAYRSSFSLPRSSATARPSTCRAAAARSTP